MQQDHSWHLTSLYLSVAASCTEPELLQKNRLCGRYRDDLPLTLYCTDALYTDLRKADLRINEISSRIKQTNGDRFVDDFLKTMTMDKKKFSKRSTTKHQTQPIKKTKTTSVDEWSTVSYLTDTLPPPAYFDLTGIDPNQIMPIQIEEREEKEVVRGSIIVLDVDAISKNKKKAPKLAAIVEHTIDHIIDKNKVGIPVLRIETNQWLLGMNHKWFNKRDNINGSWSDVLLKKSQTLTNDPTTKGFLCWQKGTKKNSPWYFQYNM